MGLEVYMIKTEQFQWSLQEGWQPELTTGKLGESVQIVFVFGSPNLLKRSGSLDAVRRAYPKAQLTGCSTAGEIHKATVRDDTVVVTAVSFEHTSVQCTSVIIEGSARSFDAGRE